MIATQNRSVTALVALAGVLHAGARGLRGLARSLDARLGSRRAPADAVHTSLTHAQHELFDIGLAHVHGRFAAAVPDPRAPALHPQGTVARRLHPGDVRLVACAALLHAGLIGAAVFLATTIAMFATGEHNAYGWLEALSGAAVTALTWRRAWRIVDTSAADSPRPVDRSHARQRSAVDCGGAAAVIAHAPISES